MHSFFDVPKPSVIGHRGCAGECPENTLLSFKTALSQGAHIIESDIQLSRDGVPILLHDPTLDRTTDGAGPAAAIDWCELEKLDAAYHHESVPGETGLRGQGVRIARLEEAFEAFPDARFNLEVKSDDPRAIAATLDLVEKFGRADRTLLAAGENPIMEALRSALLSHCVRPALGASIAEIVEAVKSAADGSSMPAGVTALQVPADFGGNPLVTRAFVDHAHAHGVEVHVWTINDLREIEALIGLGADGIITDYPGRMQNWLMRRG